MAQFIQKRLNFPRSLRVLKAGRVGYPDLGSGPVIRNDNKMPASGKMAGPHQRYQDMAA